MIENGAEAVEAADDGCGNVEGVVVRVVAVVVATLAGLFRRRRRGFLSSR